MFVFLVRSFLVELLSLLSVGELLDVLFLLLDDLTGISSALMSEIGGDSGGAVMVITGAGTGVVRGEGSIRHSEVERDGIR